MPVAEPKGEIIGGRYALERRLGRGGVGEVFLANDMQLNRWVAIKRLHADTEQAARRAELAIQEAKSLASLQHPNIVTLYDFVREGDEVCVVMEFVHGRTLESISDHAPLLFKDFLQVALQSLDGLGAAHELGMIHRDIKPSNLMIADLPGGKFQVKILDFGLAKVISEPSLQTVDASGSLLGSIYTMAPEQLEHRTLDQRTDLYSLGCVLYHALTTRNPFEGDTIATVITAHLQHRFEPLAPMRPDVAPEVCAWVERLFSREIEQRPGSAEDAARELQGLVGTAMNPTGPIPPELGPKRPAVAMKSTPSGARGKPTLTTPPFTEPRQASGSSQRLLPAIGVSVAVIALGAAVVWFFGSSPSPSQAPSPITNLAPAADGAKAADLPAPARPATENQNSAILEIRPDQGKELLDSLGQEVRVQGTIGRYGENKTGTIRFLNFKGTQRGDLSLVFFVKDNPEAFSQENLESFIGRQVSIQGTLTEYNGTPQIEIHSMDQITAK